MKRYLAYLHYVGVHKMHVFRAACTLGVPWLGVLHDISKLRPSELLPYARHFYEPNGAKKTRPGADGFYDDDPDDRTFDRAWLLHIRRNRHHPQHWVTVVWTPCNHWRDQILLQDDGGAKCLLCSTVFPYREEGRYNPGGVVVRVQEMPVRYRKEMLADWIGAGLAQGTPDTLAWYAARGRRHPFGPRTRRWIEQQLGYQRA